MTDGSSQGLFVVVAVVIFGIFVAISYSLFRDQLTPSLSSIFGDTTSFAQESLVPFTSIEKYTGNFSKILSKNKGEVILEMDASESDSQYLNPVGLRLDVLDAEIPWGYKMVFQYEIFVEGDTDFIISTDFNTYPVEGDSWSYSGNDNFGTTHSGDTTSNLFIGDTIKGNTWNTITVWYANDNKKNTGKVALYEKPVGTIIGIQLKDAYDKNVSKIKIRNLQYKIVKM